MIPERPRPGGAVEEVRGGGGRHRHERAAADGLDDPPGDELVERLRHPGDERPDREQHEGAEEEPARAPQVGEAACEGHRRDVEEQVGVDDPRRLPQLRPVADVRDDPREGHRRDHQLEAGEEDADPQDGEQDVGRAAIHPRECTAGGRRDPSARAGPAGLAAGRRVVPGRVRTRREVRRVVCGRARPPPPSPASASRTGTPGRGRTRAGRPPRAPPGARSPPPSPRYRGPARAQRRPR